MQVQVQPEAKRTSKRQKVATRKDDQLDSTRSDASLVGSAVGDAPRAQQSLNHSTGDMFAFTDPRWQAMAAQSLSAVRSFPCDRMLCFQLCNHSVMCRVPLCETGPTDRTSLPSAQRACSTFAGHDAHQVAALCRGAPWTRGAQI